MINKSFISLSIWILAFFVLQVSIVPLLCPAWLSPNLITIAAVFISVNFVSQTGLLIVFLLGLLLDLFSANFLGIWAASFVSVFLIFLLLAQNLFLESKVVILITTSLAAIAAELIAISATGVLFDQKWFGLFSIFANGIFSGVIALFIFPLLSRSLKDR